MFAAGILEESRQLLAAGYSPESKPMQSLGYQQALRVIRGGQRAPAMEECQAKTGNTVKRQMTWFRKDKRHSVDGRLRHGPALQNTKYFLSFPASCSPFLSLIPMGIRASKRRITLVNMRSAKLAFLILMRRFDAFSERR